MGVINDAEAAKHIAKTKGLGSNPRLVDADIAIGVIIIAVAAFEETSVRIIDIKYIIASKNIACGGRTSKLCGVTFSQNRG